MIPLSPNTVSGDTKSEFTWRVWTVCGLLLMASAINYMDRQTLASAAKRITEHFQLTEEQYGELETAFGLAFAGGSILFGFLADKVPIRVLYPVVLLLWSAVGFLTGLARSFEELLACRTLLGLFEAAHWPCGIIAVRVLLSQRNRALGNGLLQSGTSIGAILTPLIVLALLQWYPNNWGLPFQIVGAVGGVWVVAWLVLTRPTDFQPTSSHSPGAAAERADAAPEAFTADGLPADRESGSRSRMPEWVALIFSRRMLVVFFVIALINTNWQILRAWMPKVLQSGYGYTETNALLFNSLWFVATDIGCLAAGFGAAWLAARGWSSFHSRWIIFFICSLLCLSSACLPWLAGSPLVLLVFLVMGAGSLGLFPIYHAFTQDISGKHQGKITGFAGVAAWGFSFSQKYYGRWVDSSGHYDWGLFFFGCMPLVAALALWLFWGRNDEAAS
jgi:MFS transporter, ACS family, hexuronate transporter